MGSSNENSAFSSGAQSARYDPRSGRIVGWFGCGGGGGMAVATLGSDTGGSIRQPASFCGVVGLMPTYGRVSRYGLIAFASSLDHIGPFGKTVKDAAHCAAGDCRSRSMDSTSADVPVPDYVAELEKPVRA